MLRQEKKGELYVSPKQTRIKCDKKGFVSYKILTVFGLVPQFDQNKEML